MSPSEKTFLAKSEIKAQDRDHRRKINHHLSQYNQAFANSIVQFPDLETARQRAKNSKWKAIENLDNYLEQFEARFTARGGKVLWAENDAQAREEILKICKEKNADTLVKSVSNVTEEIHLNDFLKENNIETIETELGAYIQQLDMETPYHMVSPALHKSKEDIARLFHDKFQAKPHLPPESMARIARQKLRKKFHEAQIGITGANFMIADIGGIALTEDEGNARLCSSLPKIHIVIVGIEKMIPSLKDLSLFWPLLSTYGRGNSISAYNSILTGPRQKTETDGPEEMYVIILDNGRTKILARDRLRESLYCIRCGACLNADPVYKNIGGHAYGTPYTGPIGAVITPYLNGMEAYRHLSFASPLSGAGDDACPLKINLEDMLLLNREITVNQHLGTRGDKVTWTLWKYVSLSRKRMNATSGKTRSKLLQKIFKKAWGERRAFPEFAQKSFNERWQEKH